MTRPHFTVERRPLGPRANLEEKFQHAIDVVRGEGIASVAQHAFDQVAADLPKDQHDAAYQLLEGLLRRRREARQPKAVTAKQRRTAAADRLFATGDA